MIKGELVEWNDDRGFGFIRVDGSGDRVFLHIRSITRIANRPRIGDRLTFRLGKGRDGRPAAVGAAIVGANPVDGRAAKRGLPPSPAQPLPDRVSLRLGVASLLALLACAAVWLGGTTSWLLVLYLGVGVVSIATYWVDKNAAESGRWRTPEKSLHAIDLAGGIIGGLVAQALLRHKTSKPDYALITFGIALLHAFALCALLAAAYDLV